MHAGELILTVPHADSSRDGLDQLGLDQFGFDQLMAAHQERVLRTAYRLLGRMEDAQDVCQEVFLRLLKRLEASAGPEGSLTHQALSHQALSHKAWLYRVTVNLCHDHYRKHRRLELVDTEPVDAAVGFAEALEQSVEMEERKRLLTLGLKHLSERERSAIVLRDVEGLSTTEVASILGIEEVTVRSQCSSARAKLAVFVRRAGTAARRSGEIGSQGTNQRLKGANEA